MVREGTNASCWADRFCSSIRPLRSNRGNCDIGEKSISCPQMPGLHQQSYTEQGLLSCPHCSRSFKGQSNYQRHLLVHTGECPHRCPVCDRGFSQAANLQRHMRIHVEKGGFPAVAPLLQYQVSQQVALEEYGESRGPQSQSVFTLGQKGQESSTVDRSMAEMRSETVGTRGGREERKKEAQEEVCDVGPEFKSCSFQDECGAAGKGGESVMPEWKVGVRQPHVLGNLLGERPRPMNYISHKVQS
ncbi:hypothetical protein JZ751_007409 [Albula glossodonta]|uniref:C2H2-type domain-containing protein n=1 Tax=Albula glossodonta TaxID=121402 RepID=A0A8T2N9V4_9TELE|nr:hypothetical protein JZ751_007409 [Albula glossodonta]